MSGSSTHLEVELLIGWDTLAHSIQKLLNVNHIGYDPKMALYDYQPETEYINQSESSSTTMPPMCEPMFHRETLLKYTATEEEFRKCKIKIVL